MNPDANDQAVVRQQVQDAVIDGLLLLKCATPGKKGAVGCWFGGKPTLPRHIDWPVFEGHEYGAIPLTFLAQINLSEVPMPAAQTGLPEHGTLFFFFEPLRGSIHSFDSGGYRVVYVADDVTGVKERKMPPYPNFADDAEMGEWRKGGADGDINRWNFSFLEIAGNNRDLHRGDVFFAASSEEIDAMHQVVNRAYGDRVGVKQAPEKCLHNMFVGPFGDGWSLTEDIPLLSLWFDPELALFHDDQRCLVFGISKDDLLKRNFAAVRLFDH